MMMLAVSSDDVVASVVLESLDKPDMPAFFPSPQRKEICQMDP